MKEFNLTFELDDLEQKWQGIFDEMIHEEIEKDEDKADDAAVGIVEKERQLAFENICKEHKSDLARTGLALELAEPVGFKSEDSDNPIERGSGRFVELMMFFKLSDGKKFLGYLDSLDRNNLSENQLAGIKTVAIDLLLQLREEYDTTDSRDTRMIELLGNLSEIVKRYKEFNFNDEGFSEDISSLEKYREILKGKYLREFLVAEKLGLVSIVNFSKGEDGDFELGVCGYEPAHWHRYMHQTAEDYKKRWDSVLGTLTMIGKNKNAKNFLKKLTEESKTALQFAKKDIDTHTDPHVSKKRSEAELDEYKIVMDEVYERLESL